MIALLIIIDAVLLHIVRFCEMVTMPLFIVFLVLQLTGVIAWSWVIIFIPLMAVPVLFIFQVILVAIITLWTEQL